MTSNEAQPMSGQQERCMLGPDTEEIHEIKLEAGGALRDLAEGSRLVDEILRPLFFDEQGVARLDEEGIPLTADKILEGLDELKKLQLVYKLYEVIVAYPNLFDGDTKYAIHVHGDGKTDVKQILQALPEIIRKQGLPIKPPMDYVGTKKISAEDLEAEAEQRENIAVALHLYPPSEDFNKKFGFQFYSYTTLKQKIDKVLGLLGSEEYHRSGVQWLLNFKEHFMEELQKPESTGLKLFELLNSSIGLVKHYCKNKQYWNQVDQDLRLGSGISLDEAKDLILAGFDVAVEDSLKKVQEYREAYNMILSGEASTYINPHKQAK